MSTPLPIQHQVSLRAFNTFGLDAFARALLAVDDVALLTGVVSDPAWRDSARLVLGTGSNVVFTRDFDGLVLHMCNRGIAVVDQNAQRTLVKAAAGENWHDFVRWTLANGLPGLENLSLIPGSVGAAPVQNIGAYGVELEELFDSVTVFDLQSGALHTLSRSECAFSYRDSIFKHGWKDRAVIVDVTFSLPRHWQARTSYADLATELAATGITEPDAVQISDAVIAVRQRKLPDPAMIGNAGSFFKNPIVAAEQRDALLERYPKLASYPQPDGRHKLAAGWLIEQCGWKGRSLGPVGVYAKQALVLVNHGGATGADLVRLAQAVQTDVEHTFGVLLEPEPVFI